MEEKQKNDNQLEGRNAILEALRSSRDMEKLLVLKGNVEGTIKELLHRQPKKVL